MMSHPKPRPVSKAHRRHTYSRREHDRRSFRTYTEIEADRSENDVHVVPTNQEHDSSPQCWCRPASDYEDVVSGGRVWLHRRAHDLPHREIEPLPPPNPSLMGLR